MNLPSSQPGQLASALREAVDPIFEMLNEMLEDFKIELSAEGVKVLEVEGGVLLVIDLSR